MFSHVESKADSLNNMEPYDDTGDVFGVEEGHAVSISPSSALPNDPQRRNPVDQRATADRQQIKYKTLTWPIVAVLMIAEIVSNGMLSLPYALATIGLVPGIVVLAFLGISATYTTWLLVKFKLRHPEVHNMGDAGYILFGAVGREVLSFGTLAFAVFATGSQFVAGQLALAALSNNRLCSMLYTGIFAAATLVCSFPRTFDRLGWLGVPSVACIIIAAIVGMIGAGLHPTPNGMVVAARTSSFYNAFVAVTNPVFAYAGHFMFFSLISEMKRPQDAMRSGYVLQSVATGLYIVFSVVTYVYLGRDVASPSFLSLTPKWAKAAFGIALPNFLVAGALYSHLAAKLVFVRIFRGTHHLHEHTVPAWSCWTLLIIGMNGAAFVLAVGVPVFNYVVGLAASLFAAWYTYGIAGGLWLYDAWHGGYKSWSGGPEYGWQSWRKRWAQTLLACATVLMGAFICVAGVYVSIKGIVIAYRTGAIMAPFAC